MAFLFAEHQPLEEVLRFYPKIEVVDTWEEPMVHSPSRLLPPFQASVISSICHKLQVQFGIILLHSIELLVLVHRLERYQQQGHLMIFDTIKALCQTFSNH